MTFDPVLVYNTIRMLRNINIFNDEYIGYDTLKYVAHLNTELVGSYIGNNYYLRKIYSDGECCISNPTIVGGVRIMKLKDIIEYYD